jgi:hypothetical protein
MSTEKKKEEKFQPPVLFLNDEVRLPWGTVEGPPLSSHHEPRIYQGPLRDEDRAPPGTLTESERQERSEFLSSDHGPLTETDRKRLLYLLSKA